jgi:hypothetical protein
VTQQTTTQKRPFVATILAIGAGIAGVLAVVHALQALGILPYFLGPITYRNFNLWYAFTWGLMAYVYFWLVQMLWHVQRSAWMFLVVISLFELVLNTTYLVVGQVTWSDVSVSFIINGLILIYCMLPGTKRAFGVE